MPFSKLLLSRTLFLSSGFAASDPDPTRPIARPPRPLHGKFTT